MTKEEIIEMAKQAGMDVFKSGFRYMDDFDIYKFAKLVEQHEREEIAQFIEKTRLDSLPYETALHYARLLGSYSTAIRARGQE